MTIENKLLFPSQEQEEKIFLLIRKHWFNYVIFVFFALLMLAAFVIGSIYWSSVSSNFSTTINIAVIIFASIYLLFLLAIELYGVVSYYLDIYIVTDRRVVDIIQRGFFNREISELHLHQVQDVDAKVNGFFSTMFHFGDVFIQTAGERENFIFRSIPHPYTVSKQIIDLHENLIDKNRHIANAQLLQRSDSGSPFHEVEPKAKKLLKESTFKERLKNHGMVQAKVSKTKSKNKVKIKKNPLISRIISPQLVNSKEGELHEGEEINLV